jgi:hypothetical protein
MIFSLLLRREPGVKLSLVFCDYPVYSGGWTFWGGSAGWSGSKRNKTDRDAVKENRLYWFLDVCPGEDGCRARTNPWGGESEYGEEKVNNLALNLAESYLT